MELLSLLNGAQEAISTITTVLTVISLILGLLQCFFGYRYLKAWITFFGFVIGISLGYVLTAGLDISDVVHWIIAIAAGIFLGAASFFLYKVGIFIFIGLCAAALGLVLLEKVIASDILLFIIVLVLFIVFGILGVKFQKPIIIVITSVSGATSCGTALKQLIPAVADREWYMFAIIAVLAIAGISLQLIMNKNRK
ncbi:MAG: DUF4203 domain-containing protein [Lachnospiraceae bacterium]|jgi:hypothetical protein